MRRGTLPPDTDALSLPYLADFHQHTNAAHAFALFPSSVPGAPPTTVTFLEFGRACQRFARAVCAPAAAPVPPGKGEVVGLIANCDSLMYVTAIVGFTRAGLTPFPISPRNSAAAVVDMLRKVSSHRVMTTASSTGPLLAEIRAQLDAEGDGYAMAFEEVPALDAVYPRLGAETAEDAFEPIPLPDEQAFVGGVVFLAHSSGSTGFPKPIPFSREVVRSIIHTSWVKELVDDPRDLVMGGLAIPPFHAMGIYKQTFFPLFTARPTTLFAPQHPRPPVFPTPDTVLQAFRDTGANLLLLVPFFMEPWSEDPSAIEFLKTAQSVSWGGGPLPVSVGDKLAAAGVKTISYYGGTEWGCVSVAWGAHLRDPQDWPWVEIAPHTRPRWVDQRDGTFELQFLTCDTHVPCVENLDDARGYNTKDVWIPHPKKKNFWRLVGRADDVIMMANGEKVVPVPMESVIASSPLVAGCVMFGRERNQCGVLVEPAPAHVLAPGDGAALSEFRNALWPSIEAANRDAPAFARMYKEMILVASPTKPLPRAPKGTVKRKAALLEYAAEIDAMYDAVASGGKWQSLPAPAVFTDELVVQWLSELVKLSRGGVGLEHDLDLFEQGFDSLSATYLRNTIIAGLRASADPAAKAAAVHIPDAFVYASPTIELLARAVVALVHPARAGAPGTHVAAIDAMVAKYARALPALPANPAPRPEAETVLLTGSTGGLGSELLAAALQNPKVAKVYALNRRARDALAKERNELTFVDRGLDGGLLSSPKLVFIDGDLSLSDLGLGEELYAEVKASVTTIIHNAWRLDFNLSLASFEPMVRGTRHLVDLAFACPHAAHVRFLFTSSMGVTQAWPRDKGPYPEAPVDDPQYAVGPGYGESKYVCERVLLAAADQGLHTTSFRIGQITGGAANGAWSVNDWVPSLVKTSVALGALPSALGVASWIPPNVVVNAILDVALSPADPERALNLVHPHPTSWDGLMSDFSAALLAAGVVRAPLPLLPAGEWFAKLQAAAPGADEATLRRVPGLKLLDFFAGTASADDALRAAGDGAPAGEAGNLRAMYTEKAQAASGALRSARTLVAEDVQRWVAYWQEKGFCA